MDEDAVVAVIGSGMSGCSVAAELARHGVPVAVFEAGPDAGADHVATRPEPASLLDPALDRHFSPFNPEAAGPHFGAGAGLRRRVGGRSLYWRGICLRIEGYALADWPPAVRAALEGTLYREVEGHLEAWAGRALDAVRSDRELELLRAVRSAGYETAQATPRALRRLSAEHWDVYSPIAEVPSGAIQPERAVVRLTPIEDDRVELLVAEPTGIGRTRARAAVLCAGTVENARLASSIARPDEETARTFAVVDHHVQGWVAATARGAGPEASVLAVRDERSRSNLFVESSALGDAELLDAWAMGEQIPSPASAVSFDAVRPPRFDVRFEEPDREVLAEQAHLLDELAAGLNLSLAPRPSRFDDLLEFDVAVERATKTPGRAVAYYCRLGTLDHESSSLALGGAHVDETGRLRGTGPIFVAGPATFPRPGAANPALTILATSRLVAHNVLSALRETSAPVASNR